MLQATLRGRFVSVHTEVWGGQRPGRRDTIHVLDERDGKCYAMNPPRGEGVHPVVPEAHKLAFGTEVECSIEQRAYAADGRAQTIFILHDVKPATVSAGSK